MSQIVCRNKKFYIKIYLPWRKNFVHTNITKKTYLTTRKTTKVPKGLLLKSNLALCTDNNVLTHSTHHHKYVTKS